MSDGVILSEEVYGKLKQMYRWYIAHKGRLNPAQTRKGRGSDGGGIVLAYPQETPGATTDISCRIRDATTGQLVTVTVDPIWSGGGNLNTAEPSLTSGGNPFWVKNVGGTWRNVTTFHKVDECP